MLLYHSPGACSLVPLIVLRECALPFTLERVDLAHQRTAGGADFRVINPKGQVPLLELDDGTRLSEGAVIAQFIAEHAGAASLLPASGLARYRVLEWQSFVGTELHKAFTPLFKPGLDPAAQALLRGRLREKFTWVNEQLEGRRHLTGESFTLADAYLFVVARWAPFVGLELQDLAQLQRFLADVAERPAVRAALDADKAAGKA